MKNKDENINAKQKFIKSTSSVDRKFNSIDPYKEYNLKIEKMYWDNTGEKIARVGIIIIRLLMSGFSLFLFNIILKNISVIIPSLANIINSYWIYLIVVFACIEIVWCIIYIVPMIITKRVVTLHTWGIVFIIFGILYFIFWEFLSVGITILATIISSSGPIILPYSNNFIIILSTAGNLFFSISVIIFGSILIVKSDLIKRALTIE